MSQRLSISVIVPAYRAAHYLERALPPLMAMQRAGAITEVIVVDDFSPEPSTIEMAERHGAAILRMTRNGGPGAARNLGAQHAGGDILWFVDADVVVHETGPKMIAAAFADSRTGAVFGSYDDNPPEKNFASTYKNLVHRYYHQRARADSKSFWTGCGAVRRAVYRDVGGSDERQFGRPAIEDIELGHRIGAAGWKIRLMPDLLSTHLKRWTLWEVIRTDIIHRAIPWSYLILSARAVSNDLNVSAGERLKAIAAGLWALSFFMIPAAIVTPVAILAFIGMTAIVAALNLPLLAFFAGVRGIGFALKAVLYHQLYYLYSGATFAYCALRFFIAGGRRPVISARREGAAAE